MENIKDILSFRESLFRWVVILVVRFFAAFLLLCFLIVASMLLEFQFYYPCCCCEGEDFCESAHWPCVCTNADHNQLTLSHPKTDSVRCCGRALKRRRSGYGRVGCLSHAPVFHRSSSLADVNFAPFTGNSVNDAVLFSRVGRVFWPY